MPRHLLLLAALALAACDSDGLDRADERITDAVLTLSPEGDGPTVRIVATDADADGDADFYTPTFVRLRAGTRYDGTLELRDGDADRTAEIRAEAETYLARIAVSPDAAGDAEPTDRESDYTDVDTNGADLPVGLRFRLDVSPNAAGAGTVDVTLYHFDVGAKTSADGLSDATDLRAEFPVTFSPPAAGPLADASAW